MAVQQWLGLLSERRTGARGIDLANSPDHRPIITHKGSIMSRSAQKYDRKERKRWRNGKFLDEEGNRVGQFGRHLAYTEEKEPAYAWSRGRPGKMTE